LAILGHRFSGAAMAEGKALKQEDLGNPLQTLQKLLPIEVTGAFLVIHSLFNSTDQPTKDGLALLLGSAVVLAICFFFILTTPRFNVSSKVHRFFYCGCFVVWAVSIEVDKISQIYSEYTQLPRIIAIILVLVSFVVPFYLPRIANTDLVQP
jgi:hypothetical protein